MNKKELQSSLKHSQIQARAAWRMVDALCAVYGINNDWRDEETFFAALKKKCFEEAQKEEQNLGK